MRILGIVAALISEARCLAKLPSAAAGVVQLPGGALLHIAGIGAEQAHAAAQLLIERGATALLSWGSAGGLQPKLSPGNLILPKTVSYPKKGFFSTDHGWQNRLVTQLTNHLVIHTESLAQSHTVLRNPAEKFDFGKLTDAIAVDLESGSVAEVAEEKSLPFMVIRAIADPLEQNIPPSALTAIDERGRLRPFHLLGTLARNPADFTVLNQLRRNFTAARTTLTTVARLAGADFLAF